MTGRGFNNVSIWKSGKLESVLITPDFLSSKFRGGTAPLSHGCQLRLHLARLRGMRLPRYCGGLVLAGLIAGLASGGAAEVVDAGAGPAKTLYMIGDSTMADKPVIPANAERGWGQMLPAYFKSTMRIENHAMNGRSTKSFLDEGRWAAITNKLTAGDWVIIQFAHNDEKQADPKRYAAPFGDFKTNLTRYVREARALGAAPILATAVARRSFGADGKLKDTHGDYIRVTREVASEQSVSLLELNTRSSEIVQALGPERSKKIYLWVGPDEFPALEQPKEDNTHFCAYGATRICDLAVGEIQKNAPELAKHLRIKK
jgi:lysophospholipase L1-like esterase